MRLARLALLAGATLVPSCGDEPAAVEARQQTAEAWAALRSYGAKIALLYRLGGGVVLATLVALIAGLVRLERRRARSVP